MTRRAFSSPTGSGGRLAKHFSSRAASGGPRAGYFSWLAGAGGRPASLFTERAEPGGSSAVSGETRKVRGETEIFFSPHDERQAANQATLSRYSFSKHPRG